MQGDLPFDELEQAYELLAVTLDEVGETQEQVFLCKLALALANKLPNYGDFHDAVSVARQDLGG